MGVVDNNIFQKLILDGLTSDPDAPANDNWKLYAKPDGIYARSSNTTVGPLGTGGGGAPTTAKYVTTEVDGTLSAEVVIPGLAGSPDVRAGGADDDEFDTTDTSDPMTGWTTIGTPTTHDINSTAKSHYYVKKAAASGANMTGIYKAKSPTFTVTCKLADFTIPIANYMSVFLFIGEATPGKAETLEVLHNSTASIGHYSNTSPTSGGTERVRRDLKFAAPIYLRWVVTSSSNVACYYSSGGRIWTPLNTGYNPGFTVGCAGVGVQPNNGTYDIEAIFDWVRFT